MHMSATRPVLTSVNVVATRTRRRHSLSPFLRSVSHTLASNSPITLAVRYTAEKSRMVHQPNAPLPIQNGGELAVIYCFVFLYIATRGSGILSVDSFMGTKNAPRTANGSAVDV